MKSFARADLSDFLTGFSDSKKILLESKSIYICPT